MRVLVIGESGQLATELVRLSSLSSVVIQAIGRPGVDLTSQASVEAAVGAVAPQLIINAAAYTAVDKAEQPEEASRVFALNRDGPGALASLCAAKGIALVHISTDYVFDGNKPAPYIEDDPKSPLGVYGRSKSEGEDLVLASRAIAAVVRTSWVYASHGANFVRTMIRLAETKNEVGVVSDQVGRPTWARDLANDCLSIGLALASGDMNAGGVFHVVGGGDASWADLAEAVFSDRRRRGHSAPRLKRIASADYPTPARRPKNSRLETTKAEALLGHRMRPWDEALRLCLDELD